jgi:hypothetical protein
MRSIFLAGTISLAGLTLVSFVGPQGSGHRGNLPPICAVDGPLIVECQGELTSIQLDGLGSSDPEGRPLRFNWAASPGTLIDDPRSPTPTLTIDTSSSCEVAVGVRLRVSDGFNVSLCRIAVYVVAPSGPRLLELDVKPGSCPNPLQVTQNGLTPVSLLGTAGFDVQNVDTSTLLLGRADGVGAKIAPTRLTQSDTGTPLKDDGCDCHTLTGDGITDLSLKFDTQAMVSAFELAGVDDMSFLTLELTGLLENETAFAARDCIRVQH